MPTKKKAPAPKKPEVQPKPLPKPQPKASEVKTIEFDASGKVLGRLSTEIANALRGKNKPTFQPHLAMGDKVVIINASKIRLTGNKINQKLYYRHSGYIGNLKSTKMSDKMIQDPSWVLRHSIYGMLPKNKLRAIWMKNLTIFNAAPATPERSDGGRGEKNA